MTTNLDLEARFEFGGRRFKGTILDVSQGGVRADLSQAGDQGLKTGDRGLLLLRFRDLWTENEVEIRNIQKSIVHLSYCGKNPSQYEDSP